LRWIEIGLALARREYRVSAFAGWQGIVPSISRDYYLRVRIAPFERMAFIHLWSQEDDDVYLDAREQLGLDPVVAGSTEWAGRVDGQTVSIAWDWAVTPDLQACVLSTRPRSNVRLICESGYDMPMEATTLILLRKIELLSWHECVWQIT
jgi:hypothetical protein